MTDITVAELDALAFVATERQSNRWSHNVSVGADKLLRIIAAARRGVASSLEPTSDIAGVKERLRRCECDPDSGWKCIRCDALRVIEELETAARGEAYWRERHHQRNLEIERLEADIADLTGEKYGLLTRCQQLENERDEWRARAGG